MPVYTSGAGYNGVTGSKATYSEAEGMWVDANGERIRTDAIVPGEPPSAAAPAAGPASPAAAPQAEGAVSPGPMQALATASGAGYQEGTAGALNPALGKRLVPSALAALGTMAGRNY